MISIYIIINFAITLVTKIHCSFHDKFWLLKRYIIIGKMDFHRASYTKNSKKKNERAMYKLLRTFDSIFYFFFSFPSRRTSYGGKLVRAITFEPGWALQRVRRQPVVESPAADMLDTRVTSLRQSLAHAPLAGGHAFPHPAAGFTSHSRRGWMSLSYFSFFLSVLVIRVSLRLWTFSWSVSARSSQNTFGDRRSEIWER